MPTHPPDRQADGSSDRRWIVLAESGAYVTLGRGVDPSEADIEAAEEGLRRLAMGGWLAVMSGSQYASEVPSVIEVRRLGEPRCPFAEAVGELVRRLENERRQG